MKLDINGSQNFDAQRPVVWAALNDPGVLTRCIPGCEEMTETGPDAYDVRMQLKVAAVGGSFVGRISLSNLAPPEHCTVTVSGEGTLGLGQGAAEFTLTDNGEETQMTYAGAGEISGLVAGVGQRVLKGVSKHLIKQFFKALEREIEARNEGTDRG